MMRSLSMFHCLRKQGNKWRKQSTLDHRRSLLHGLTWRRYDSVRRWRWISSYLQSDMSSWRAWKLSDRPCSRFKQSGYYLWKKRHKSKRADRIVLWTLAGPESGSQTTASNRDVMSRQDSLSRVLQTLTSLTSSRILRHLSGGLYDSPTVRVKSWTQAAIWGCTAGVETLETRSSENGHSSECRWWSPRRVSWCLGAAAKNSWWTTRWHERMEELFPYCDQRSGLETSILETCVLILRNPTTKMSWHRWAPSTILLTEEMKSGSRQSPSWSNVSLSNHWKWTKGKFCSREEMQTAYGSIRVGQSAYIKSLDFVPLGKLRKEHSGDDNVSKNNCHEIGVGSSGNLVRESRSDLSRPVMILQSRFNKVQESDMWETKRVIRLVKTHTDLVLFVCKISLDQICLASYGDVSDGSIRAERVQAGVYDHVYLQDFVGRQNSSCCPDILKISTCPTCCSQYFCSRSHDLHFSPIFQTTPKPRRSPRPIHDWMR